VGVIVWWVTNNGPYLFQLSAFGLTLCAVLVLSMFIFNLADLHSLGLSSSLLGPPLCLG
jgi:hypothetical protein